MRKDDSSRRPATSRPAPCKGSQFAWVHFNRGLALARAGLLDAARDAYDLAIRTDPAFAEAMANRAMVNLELNRLEPVLDDLSRAIALGRDDVAVLAARGEALARLGRLDEAQRQFQALLADDPDNAAVLVARAMTRLRTDPRLPVPTSSTSWRRIHTTRRPVMAWPCWFGPRTPVR